MRLAPPLTVAALAAALLAGCHARSTSPSAPTCTGCHGGVDNDTGAPPRDTAGRTLRTLPSVGAHSVHLAAGVACENCHKVPARTDDAGHLDGTTQVIFSDLASQGLPSRPTYARAAGTCAVYCHGTGLNLGGSTPAPSWTSQTSLGCTGCHAAPPSFGPHQAGMALTTCSACHPTSVDAAGRIIKGGTHLNGAKDANVGTRCTDCHGDAVRDEVVALNKAAPPLDTHAATASAKVGAHLAHLHAGALAPAFACRECHDIPSGNAHASANLGDGKVKFNGPLGTTRDTQPAFAAGTCSNVYCHGATVAGGTKKAPSWAGGAPEAACGTCHGFPPPIAPHSADLTTIASCSPCHPSTANANGTLNLAFHVDGTVDVIGTAPHPAPWPAAQHGQAALAGFAACTNCHGTDFGTSMNAQGLSCNACHASPATFGYAGANHPTWQQECTFCHGDSAGTRTPDPAFPLVGNPPVRENLAGPPRTATGPSAGAHQRHSSGDATAGNQLATPFDCATCHGPTPPSGLGHVDGQVLLAYDALASQGTTATPTTGITTSTPVTCANYCHGATLQGGGNTSPSWTGGAAEVSCQSCHASPYPYTAAGNWHVQNPDCAQCHAGYSTSAPLTAAAQASHVDGRIDVAISQCTDCHSQFDLPWRDSTGATSGARVGAHAKHIAGMTISSNLICTACHSIPGALQHANGQVDIAWSPRASQGNTPSPAGPISPGAAVTCANYCHGATSTGGSNTTPSWTGGALGCTSCHGAPPGNGAGGHFANTAHVTAGCYWCHDTVAGRTGTTDFIKNPALHVNGTANFQFTAQLLTPALNMTFVKSGTSYTCANGCHGTDPNSGQPISHTAAGW